MSAVNWCLRLYGAEGKGEAATAHEDEIPFRSRTHEFGVIIEIWDGAAFNSDPPFQGGLLSLK